jgi:hypothetical protein
MIDEQYIQEMIDERLLEPLACSTLCVDESPHELLAVIDEVAGYLSKSPANVMGRLESAVKRSDRFNKTRKDRITAWLREHRIAPLIGVRIRG